MTEVFETTELPDGTFAILDLAGCGDLGLDYLPLDALASGALLLLHTEMCSWCDAHGLCAVGQPHADAVNRAVRSNVIHAVAA